VIGASPVGRAVGRALQNRGITVLVWTADDEYASAAKSDGLSVYQGNLIDDASGDAPSQLDQLYYALAVGEDEALNAMLATDLSEYFGRDRVFQLPVGDKRTADFYTRAQVLFHHSASHDELLSRIKAGAEITVTEVPAAGKIGKDAGADWGAALPMFVVTPGKHLRILTAEDQPDLKAEQELVGLISRSPGRG